MCGGLHTCPCESVEIKGQQLFLLPLCVSWGLNSGRSWGLAVMESSSCLPRHGFEEKQYWDRRFLLGGSKSKAHGGSGTSHEHMACYHSLTGWVVTKHRLSCWPLLTQHPSSLVIFTKGKEQLTYYQTIHLSIATSNPEDDRQAFLAYLEDLSPPLWLHWVSL